MGIGLSKLSECGWVVVCWTNVPLASTLGGCATSQSCDRARKPARIHFLRG